MLIKFLKSKIISILKKNKINIIDLHKELFSQLDVHKKLFAQNKPLHFNNYGYKSISEKIFEVIAEIENKK